MNVPKIFNHIAIANVINWHSNRIVEVTQFIRTTGVKVDQIVMRFEIAGFSIGFSIIADDRDDWEVIRIVFDGDDWSTVGNPFHPSEKEFSLMISRMC